MANLETSFEYDAKTPKVDASLINKRLHTQLIDVKYDLDILRKDPKSPLYHVKSFEALNLGKDKCLVCYVKFDQDLAYEAMRVDIKALEEVLKIMIGKPELLQGLYAMHFDSPSKIQETALPAMLADPPANLIAQSQSGTGKTAAFVLGMLSRVNLSNCYPQCLCLAPTYELALQIGQVTQMMAKFMDVKIMFAIRGSIDAQSDVKPSKATYCRARSISCFTLQSSQAMFEQSVGASMTNKKLALNVFLWKSVSVLARDAVNAHIVIGTPGTVLDWALKFKVIDLQKITVFVLDEADIMIDVQGHMEQSVRIYRGLKKDCQMLLFSATYEDEVMNFASTVVPNALVLRLRREELSLDNIKQFYIECDRYEDKFTALSNIYGAISIGQSMIFCRTRKTALQLAESMHKEGLSVALLTADLTVEQRSCTIARFRNGQEKAMITTNVSSRGIDIEQVTVVINFDMPTFINGEPDYDTYIHRIGRTGRFGKRGLAINMIDSAKAKHTLELIEAHFGRNCEQLDAKDMDEIERITEH